MKYKTRLFQKLVKYYLWLLCRLAGRGSWSDDSQSVLVLLVWMTDKFVVDENNTYMGEQVEWLPKHQWRVSLKKAHEKRGHTVGSFHPGNGIEERALEDWGITNCDRHRKCSRGRWPCHVDNQKFKVSFPSHYIIRVWPSRTTSKEEIKKGKSQNGNM